MTQTAVSGVAPTLPHDSPRIKAFFDAQGYVILRGLFAPDDVRAVAEAFGAIASGPAIPGVFEKKPQAEGGDILDVYPRVMMPHRLSEVARRALLYPAVLETLSLLLGEPPLAAQSMYYFKPPSARGQALHQDNFFLLVEPGTCVAAWTAIDDIDDENGGMVIVPQTQAAEIVCPAEADVALSFTTQFVPVPEGHVATLAQMKAGDTLFFNGNMIHGSGPNRSHDRFRRAFIGHYVPASTVRISWYYLPLLRPDGAEITLEVNDSGGACGDTWQGAAH